MDTHVQAEVLHRFGGKIHTHETTAVFLDVGDAGGVNKGKQQLTETHEREDLH